MKNIVKNLVEKLPVLSNLVKQNNSDIANIISKRREYVRLLYKHLLERNPLEAELDEWTNSSYSYLKILRSFIKSEEYKNHKESTKLELDVDRASMSLCKTCLVGEDKPISINRVVSWYRTVAEELINQHNTKENLIVINDSKAEDLDFDSLIYPHPILTIITSLYKGERYTKVFLENITSQTIFKRCQLFIIDAKSPENEHTIIKPYLEKYLNIKYVRVDKNIGIYEAWNLAIKDSDSEFLTNANIDDLHRSDALEMKVKFLKENREIDVVYSDVYYSFIPNLTFEIAEKGGIVTNLPTANKFNLLNFNSPHNSPMWRRSLHEKIGYFDTTYKSAGDHEFWLRAAFSGIAFMKIPEPVVVYYQNPDGISTQKDSPGNIEGPETVKRYRSLLEL